MKRKIMDLLKHLEQAIPPGERRHHSITFAQYGSDKDGWEDKLALNVWVPGKGAIQTFFIGDADLESGFFSVQIAAEIREMVAANDPPISFERPKGEAVE